MSFEGRTLGKYTVREILGRGGMGTVHRAVQEELGREVALKILDPGAAGENPQLVRRFMREASVCARLSHPNIVKVFDYGNEEGLCFYAMELLEPRTLEDLLADGPVQPRSRALAIARDLVSAFLYYLPQGIVHRDLKPANVMLTSDDKAILTDFGLVKDLMASAITQEQMVIGTPSYIAPEVIRGQPVDAATDIFQFGVVLYRMLSGQFPFGGETNRDVLRAIMLEEPKLPSAHVAEVTASLDNLVLNCIEKDRAVRYAGAEELSRDLDLAAKGGKVGRRRDTHGAAGPPPVQPADSLGAPSTNELAPRAPASARRAAAATPARGSSSRLPSARPVAAPSGTRSASPGNAGATRPGPSATSATAGLALAIACVAGLGALLVARLAPPGSVAPPASRTEAAAAAGQPPPAPPAVDPGTALMQSLLAFGPAGRADRLNARLHRTRQQHRPPILAAEAAEAASSPAAARLAGVKDNASAPLPPALEWRERALRSQWLFDAMRYEMTLNAVGGSSGLRVFESLTPLMRFDAKLAMADGTPFVQASLGPAIRRAFPPPYQVTPLFVTVAEADTFQFENVKDATVPAELDGIVTTNDIVQRVWHIPRIDVLPETKGAVTFAAFTGDHDVQSAFLLRLKPSAGSSEMVIPLLHLRVRLAPGWSVIRTSLAPGVLPPGSYSGRVTCFKITSGVGMRPNLRAVYIAYQL